MLKVYFGDIAESVYETSDYFDFNYDDEWLKDDLVKAMIKDVDDVDVLSVTCLQSPILGQITPTQLSGGVKTLILILKDEEFIFNATQCGDNCAKWILEITRNRDITICLRHVIDFGDLDLDIEILNTGEIVHTMDEFNDRGYNILLKECMTW